MSGQSELRILVVDDEPGVRLVLERMLERLGYAVVSANNAAQAFAALEKVDDIALIVLDLVLPDLKGPQVLERLEALGYELPVLISSGASAEELEELQAADNAVAGILRKPFRIPELQAAVEGCFEA